MLLSAGQLPRLPRAQLLQLALPRRLQVVLQLPVDPFSDMASTWRAVEGGSAALVADAPRAEIDLNRAERERRPRNDFLYAVVLSGPDGIPFAAFADSCTVPCEGAKTMTAGIVGSLVLGPKLQ